MSSSEISQRSANKAISLVSRSSLSWNEIPISEILTEGFKFLSETEPLFKNFLEDIYNIQNLNIQKLVLYNLRTISSYRGVYNMLNSNR